MTLRRITDAHPRRWHGKLPPTSGTYYPGDRVENITPMAGHPQGWTYSTIGTWEPYGDEFWTPHQAANVGLWMEAWHIQGLADAAAVTSWSAYKGGLVFSQATDTKQPTLQTAELNGAPIVRFDGGDILNCLSAPAVVDDSEGGLFAVVKSDVAADSALVGASRASGSSSYHWRVTPRGAADNIRSVQRSNDIADDVRGSTTAVGAGWRMIFVGSTGLSYDFEVDGVIQAKTVDTGSDNGDWIADSASLTKLSIGGLGLPAGDGNFFTGDVAMILYFSNYATAIGLKASVKEYANAVYGLGIA